MIPRTLAQSLRPLTLVMGHYGVGKTNFSCNLALDLAREGKKVTLIDLDIVNPYFRASEQRKLLEDAGITLVSPRFAEAGSSLDVPSLRGSVQPAIEAASMDTPTIIDVGGDDAGTIALGRFIPAIREQDYCALGVINHFRNLIQEPEDTVENLREIESVAGLNISALIDNSHLKDDTTEATIQEGYDYACRVSELMNVAIAAVCIPETIKTDAIPEELCFPVAAYVHNPWE